MYVQAFMYITPSWSTLHLPRALPCKQKRLEDSLSGALHPDLSFNHVSQAALHHRRGMCYTIIYFLLYGCVPFGVFRPKTKYSGTYTFQNKLLVVRNSHFSYQIQKCTHNISYVWLLEMWFLPFNFFECRRGCVWKLSCRPTVFEKSKCFAVSMFDERVFPYSPRGGIRMLRGHLHSPLLASCFIGCYVVLRSAM